MSRKKVGNKLFYLIGSAGWLLLILVLGRFWYMAAAAPNSPVTQALKAESTEGGVSVAKIEVGPFDIHRRYRSMEGPFVDQTFTIADLIESGNVQLPEPMVRWVENGSKASMTADSKATDNTGNPVGLVYSDIKKRDLYWLKGMKLQVLDENNKVLPTAEFICHMNVDVDRDIHDKAFPQGERISNTRLITLTQGQTEFKFPEGYGFPIASFETLRFVFQAANRTTDQHRRLKHLCTIEFIKDSDLKKPLVPLAWYAPYVAVNIDKTKDALASDHEMNGPSCLGMNVRGSVAPNFVNGNVIKMRDGEHLVGHWAVPPGTHVYSSPITDERDLEFSHSDRVVRAVWSHIHPMCNETTLSVCDGASKTPVWTVRSTTDHSHGLEIKHIDDLYYTGKGLVLEKGKHYEMSAKYDNITGKPQDSMVVQGIFYEDNKFVKPFFLPATIADKVASTNAPGTKAECNDVYCGIKTPGLETVATKADYGGTDIYPLFDKEKDGPLLTSAAHVQIHTSSGNINFTLDPAIAPETATQIYKLFKSGVYDGSTICQYSPGYFLQIGSSDQKLNVDYRLPPAQSQILRRLPLEAGGQAKGIGLHKKWALDLTRNKAKDSAVSSFSIMLGDEPHLDNDYTVFGHMDQDPESLATIKKITSNWQPTKLPYIAGTSDKKVGWTNKAVPESIMAKAGSLAKAGTLAVASATAGDTTSSAAASAATTSAAPKAFVPNVAKNIADRNSSSPETLPTFDPKTDGPILTSSKALTLQTSAGNIHIVIDPALAPKNATQMYSLFKAGAFTNTTISRYEPNFVLQTDVAETKKGQANTLDPKIRKMLRRLPLEVACQDKGQGLHKKYCLSMAHIDADPNTATSSFSIILGDSPHLDHKYTVFGHVVPDAESEGTLNKIEIDWSQHHPYVVSVKAEPNKIASR